jgi:hypothetical protein
MRDILSRKGLLQTADVKPEQEQSCSFLLRALVGF